MPTMNKIETFLIFSLFLVMSNTSKKPRNIEPYFIYKSVKCTTSKITISNVKCFVKAYSRTNATLNVYANLTRSIYSMNVMYDHSYRSLSNSQRSIINVTTEICSILNGTASNPVLEWVRGMIKELDSVLHPCPYEVSLKRAGL